MRKRKPRHSKKPHTHISAENTARQPISETGLARESIALTKPENDCLASTTQQLLEPSIEQQMDAKVESQNSQTTPPTKLENEEVKQNEVTDVSISNAKTPPVYSEFVGHQYIALHELKRMYNGMIFQAPTILVAVVGVALAGADKLAGDKDSKQLLVRLLPYLGLILGIFSFILSYWAYRSRVLLMAIEKALADMDQTFGVAVRAYPFQLIKPKGKKRLGFAYFFLSLKHSTVLIILFMFSLTFTILGVCIYYILSRIF